MILKCRLLQLSRLLGCSAGKVANLAGHYIVGHPADLIDNDLFLLYHAELAKSNHLLGASH